MSLNPAAFAAGVGTGGTVTGVAKYLEQQHSRARIYPVEPAESPTFLRVLGLGHHRIQDISDGFIPSILKLDELAPVISIHDGDAILMAQKLAAELGLAVGISCGANLIAVLKVAEDIWPDAMVATVFCDDNKKYPTTDLMQDEPVRSD
jgi:cysteine synthase A